MKVDSENSKRKILTKRGLLIEVSKFFMLNLVQKLSYVMTAVLAFHSRSMKTRYLTDVLWRKGNFAYVIIRSSANKTATGEQYTI